MSILKNNIYLGDLDLTLSGVNLDFFSGKNILIAGATSLVGATIVDILLRYNQKSNSKIKLFLTSRTKKKYIDYFGLQDNCTFIDVRDNLSDETGQLRLDLQTGDGVHLNKNGYIILKENYNKFLI